MVPDLLTDNKLYIQNEDGDFVELKCGKLELPKQDESYTYSDLPFTALSTEKTFSFKMNKKQWYKFQKSLGLINLYTRKREKEKGLYIRR